MMLIYRAKAREIGYMSTLAATVAELSVVVVVVVQLLLVSRHNAVVWQKGPTMQ